MVLILQGAMLGSLVEEPIAYSTLSVVLDNEEEEEQQREALNRSLPRNMMCRGMVIRQCTELGKKVVPRLRESRLPAPSGRGGQDHATYGPQFCPSLYFIQLKSEDYVA